MTIQSTSDSSLVTKKLAKLSIATTNEVKTTKYEKTNNGISSQQRTSKSCKSKKKLITVKFPKRLVKSAATTKNYKPSLKTIDDIANYILELPKESVVIIVGAGISTPSGIPDFRSKITGLYHNIKSYDIPYPEAIFDLEYFEMNPSPFFKLAKSIYPNGTYKPNVIHKFIKLMDDKKLLRRLYTQNIDGLERDAGIPLNKLVEAHGNFFTSSCTRCSKKHDSKEVKETIMNDKIPQCKSATCLGVVKPNIVFFGEELPFKFHWYLKDLPSARLVIIMGTSLTIEPFCNIIDSVKYQTPRVLLNFKAVGKFRTNPRPNDIVITGNIVENIGKIAERLKWDEIKSDVEETLIIMEKFKKIQIQSPLVINKKDENIKRKSIPSSRCTNRTQIGKRREGNETGREKSTTLTINSIVKLKYAQKKSTSLPSICSEKKLGYGNLYNKMSKAMECPSSFFKGQNEKHSSVFSSKSSSDTESDSSEDSN